LCAADAGKDSCFGDSGGPLFTASGVQVGVVSTGGDLCADPTSPGIYAVSDAYRTLKKPFEWAKRSRAICGISSLTCLPLLFYVVVKRVSGSISWIQRTICELSDFKPSYCDLVTYKALVHVPSAAQVGWYVQDTMTRKKIATSKGAKGGRKIITVKPGRSYILVLVGGASITAKRSRQHQRLGRTRKGPSQRPQRRPQGVNALVNVLGTRLSGKSVVNEKIAKRLRIGGSNVRWTAKSLRFSVPEPP